MLIQFSVTNFLSFRDEVILSLSTNKDNSHKENVLFYKNERILPSVAIYGAKEYKSETPVLLSFSTK
jgi:uncharacterized protein